jgi:hypothetical protein
MNGVQGDQVVQAVQNVLNDWNYLNESNSAKVKAHWPPFDLTQGGEQVEPQPERLAPRTSSRE